MAIASFIRLTVPPETTRLTPGGETSLAITVENTGSVEERCRIVVRGIPDAWYNLDPPEVQLGPGTSAPARLFVHPPSVPEVVGRYVMVVQVVSGGNGTHRTAQGVELIVDAGGDVRMELQPTEVVGLRGSFRVTLRNNTERAERVALAVRSDADVRIHVDPTGPIVVPGGGTTSALVRVGIDPSRGRRSAVRVRERDIEVRALRTDADPTGDAALVQHAYLTSASRSRGLGLPWRRAALGAAALALLFAGGVLVTRGTTHAPLSTAAPLLPAVATPGAFPTRHPAFPLAPAPAPAPARHGVARTPGWTMRSGSGATKEWALASMRPSPVSDLPLLARHKGPPRPQPPPTPPAQPVSALAPDTPVLPVRPTVIVRPQHTSPAPVYRVRPILTAVAAQRSVPVRRVMPSRSVTALRRVTIRAPGAMLPPVRRGALRVVTHARVRRHPQPTPIRATMTRAAARRGRIVGPVQRRASAVLGLNRRRPIRRAPRALVQRMALRHTRAHPGHARGARYRPATRDRQVIVRVTWPSDARLRFSRPAPLRLTAPPSALIVITLRVKLVARGVNGRRVAQIYSYTTRARADRFGQATVPLRYAYVPTRPVSGSLVVIVYVGRTVAQRGARVVLVYR